MPTLFFYLIFQTLTILPWYTGILLAAAEFFGMHHIVTRVLLNSATYTDSVNNTPYFAGIIIGSIAWVLFCWFTRLLQATESHAFTNLSFAIATGLCVYNFCRAVMLDPGTCPKPASDGELKSIIEDLASEGRLNGQTFCIQCMARKPLRSKHCRICDKCVARHDHHCPWVWNCVGVNNHRQFVLFVTMLVLGIILFDYLTWQYFAALPIFTGTPTTPTTLLIRAATGTPPNSTVNPNVSPSCLLPTDLCLVTQYDTFLVVVALWATVQLSWTFVLLGGQYWQIIKQMTTFEVVNLGRYGFMGGRGGSSMQGQMGHGHGHHPHGSVRGALGRADSEDAALMGGGDSTPSTPGQGHKHRGVCGGGGFLMSLLGFDRFTKGGGGVAQITRATTAANPFDLGMWANCKDFWTRGRELGVEYDKLYDVPVEGFVEAKRRREREESPEWDGHGHSRKASRKGMFMGINLRLPGAGSSRGGYEPLSQV
ncbi:zf-DHHC-domain-containing protein [Marasmius fiardii PR-910]|nr:zf-DHHC-domain-containing protein [Marasmius fiardii PR-910]